MALNDAGLKAEELDLIIIGTVTRRHENSFDRSHRAARTGGETCGGDGYQCGLRGIHLCIDHCPRLCNFRYVQVRVGDGRRDPDQHHQLPRPGNLCVVW